MSTSKKEIRDQLAIQEDQPLNWFEPLYSNANKDGQGVPWANMKTHPAFVRWLSQNPMTGSGKSALVVGCGMGDDAVALESLGFQVTAFDVSPSAIEFCKERFPGTTVDFCQADLLKDQHQWQQKFDFVLEIYTVQALPPKYEEAVIRNIADFVAPMGQLLVVAQVGAEPRSYENGPPWILTPEHIDAFTECGLTMQESKIENDPEDDGNLYVTTFTRPSK